MTGARFLGIHALVVLGLAGAAAPAQELITQPRCELLLVDLHSLRDDVEVRAGPGRDAPYLYRGWTRGQKVELTQAGDFATLRIWDRSLAEDSRIESETWKLELMPAAPLALVVRSHGGRGDYDLSGLHLRNLTVFATAVDLRLAFHQPAPQRLELAWASVHSGRLVLERFLNARPERALFDLTDSKARIDLSGEIFDGEAEIVVAGTPASLELVLRRDVGLSVDAPAAVRQAFAAGHLLATAEGLRSQGFDAARCRLSLRFRAPVPDLHVLWEGEAAAGSGRVEGQAKPPAPKAGAGSVDAAFEAQIVEFLALVARRETTAAAVKLRELAALAPGDGRVLFLEAWLREHPNPQLDLVPILGDGEKRFQTGLDHYVQGRYESALVHFRAALSLDPNLHGVDAWIRTTELAMQARDAAAMPPVVSPPSSTAAGVEPATIATAPPVIALRSPARGSTTTRAARLELSGKVGDDAGVERIEFLVNGEPLRDAAGNPVVLRPSPDQADSVRSLDFAVSIPLRLGENQVVVVAQDKDATTHRTRERVTILREPPFHRTGAFIVLLGALLLLVPAVWILWRFMRSRAVSRPDVPASPAAGE